MFSFSQFFFFEFLFWKIRWCRSSPCLSDTLYWSTKCGHSQEGEIEGFSRAPAENQGLARTANCYPQSSLDWTGLTHVSWPQAWPCEQRECPGFTAFKLFLIGYFIENGSTTAQSGEAERRRRTEAGRAERVILGVIRHCGHWEQRVFSVVNCGQSIWLAAEQRPAALDLKIPVDFTVRGRRHVVCMFVFMCLKVTFLFYPAAKALPHPDWSCCTTLTRCMTTLHRVSPLWSSQRNLISILCQYNPWWSHFSCRFHGL